MAYCSIDLKKGEDGMAQISAALDGLYHVWENTEEPMIQAIQERYFSRAKNENIAYVFQGVDNTLSLFSDQATEAAMFAHYTGDLQYYSRQFEAISKVQWREVQQFAKKYLTRQRAVALVMQPYEEGDLVVDSSNSQYRGGNRADGAEAMIGAEKLTEAIIAGSVKVPNVSRAKQEALQNKLNVVVMPYSSSPLVQVALTFKGGGASAFPPGHYDFAQDMLLDKSYALESMAIAGFENVTFGSTSVTWEISASVANSDEAIYVLRERLENLQAYTSGKLDWAAAGKKVVWANMKLPEWWADTVQLERLLPGHYLSEWTDHGEYDALKKLGLEQVSSVLSNILRPENATLLVVGNVDTDKTLASAKTYLGGWAGWGKPPEAPVELRTTYADFPPPPARTIILVDKKISSQSDISYRCQLKKTDPAGEVAASVMSGVLDGQAWLALREQTGASYGAGVSASIYPGGMGTLTMGSLVQNNYAAKAVQAFLGLGESAKAGKLDPLLIATKKYVIAQNFAIGQQSTSNMLYRILSLIQRGRPIDYHSTWAKYLAQATIPQMQALVEPCVGHEVVTVVGPVEVIEPLFKEAGLAYEIYDWEKLRLDYAAKFKIKIKPPKEEKEKK
jgi:predicted Zn-dependent peptidase